MPTTIKEIARKAGVDHSTVSRILNNRESYAGKKTRERIQTIAREMNYQPNQLAQSLKTGKTSTIGVSAGTALSTGIFTTPYLSNVCNGIATGLGDHDQYKMLFHHFSQSNQPEIGEQLATGKAVDGLIYILYAHAIELFREQKAPEKLNAANLPFVVVHSLNIDLPFNHVGSDNHKGVYEGSKHLAEHGYKTIGFVGYHSSSNRMYLSMFQGYKSALENAKMKLSEDLLYQPVQGFSFEEGRIIARKMVEKNKVPSALLVLEESCAQGMILEFKEKGLNVPGDVAMVCAGEVSENNDPIFNLTMVEYPSKDKGKKALELLMNQINDKTGKENNQKEILVPELTLRRSCGCSSTISQYVTK